MTLKVPPAVARIAPDGNLTQRQARRLLLDIARRRQQPGTGSAGFPVIGLPFLVLMKAG